MREILFRGKRVDNGEWIQGDLLQNVDSIKIREQEKAIKMIAKSFEVSTETLGQFTGRCDNKGKKIFEGDIVKMDGWWYAAGPAGYSNNLTVVLYDEEYCGFTPMCDYDCDCGVYHPANECEVIGNIYDNPELLEGV